MEFSYPRCGQLKVVNGSWQGGVYEPMTTNITQLADNLGRVDVIAVTFHYRCGLLLYYRHQDNNLVTFIVDGALKASADGQTQANVYAQVSAPQKVRNEVTVSLVDLTTAVSS